MKKTVVTHLLAAGAGFAVCLFALPPTAGTKPSDDAASLALLPPPPSVTTVRPAASRSPAPAVVPPVPGTDVGASAPGPQEQVVRLEARVAELEAALLQARTTPEPQRQKPPPNLAPEFQSPDQLQAAFQGALRGAGFADGDVTSVDCTEYPCIVYGHGFGEPEDLPKLLEQPAFAPYKDASHSVFGFQRRGTDGGLSRFFGVAVQPRNGIPEGIDRRAWSRRIAERVNQMRDATDVTP